LHHRKKPKHGDFRTGFKKLKLVLPDTSRVVLRALYLGFVVATEISRQCWILIFFGEQVLTQGKNIPQGAIIGGKDTNGDDLWIARVFYDGGIRKSNSNPTFVTLFNPSSLADPGKAFKNSRRGAVTSYGGKEVEVEQYEVLVGNQQAVRWVQQHGRLNVNSLGGQPVE
jgi:hypothetical protein